MTAQPPKILQIFNRYLELGGEETAIRQFAQILAPQGNFSECLFDSAEWKGPDAPSKWKQAACMFYNPASARRLRQKQNEVGADAWLVHNIFPVGSPAIYHEAIRLKIPIVQFIHNFRPFSISGYLNHTQAVNARHWPRIYGEEMARGTWQRSRLKTLIFGCVLASMHWRGQYRAAKAWVAISDFMRTRFIAAGVAPDKIFRLYYPRILVNSDPNFAEEDYYLFLGRLIEDKGIKVLVDCWKILRSRLGERTPRLLVAGDGPLAGWLKNAVAANPKIEYRGFARGQEKDQLLSACRAVIQPAVWAEPLSLVIYDAFDYGKPAFVAASGGMPELVGKSNGLIHQPGDAAQLAAQIQESEQRGPEWRRRCGQSGRKWLLANTNADAWKEQLFEIVRYAQRTHSPN